MSERVFRLRTCAMAYILNYNYNLESFNKYYYDSNLVVVKVVVIAERRKEKRHNIL